MIKEKNELLAVIRDIFSSNFVSEEEKKEILKLLSDGKKEAKELTKKLKIFLTAKIKVGLK